MTGPLTPEERDFLERHSGVHPAEVQDSDFLGEIRRAMESWVPTVDPATVPGYVDVATAMGNPHARVVEGFLLYASVEDGARSYAVLEWLRGGRDVARVVALASEPFI